MYPRGTTRLASHERDHLERAITGTPAPFYSPAEVGFLQGPWGRPSGGADAGPLTCRRLSETATRTYSSPAQAQNQAEYRPGRSFSIGSIPETYYGVKDLAICGHAPTIAQAGVLASGGAVLCAVWYGPATNGQKPPKLVALMALSLCA